MEIIIDIQSDRLYDTNMEMIEKVIPASNYHDTVSVAVGKRGSIVVSESWISFFSINTRYGQADIENVLVRSIYRK